MAKRNKDSITVTGTEAVNQQSVGKLVKACSESREQAWSVEARTTQRDNCSGGGVDAGKANKVQCFDTIVLPTAGEYFIRGHVGLKEGFEGSFEPETEKLDTNKDRNWIAASSIVKVDERGNIPVRIWTFENGVRL